MYEEKESHNLPASVWLIIIICLAIVIFSITSGASYSGIQEARLSAAKASLGQIESTFLLAEHTAADENLKSTGADADNIIQSYDSSVEMSQYDQYILNAMQDSFGADRDFDFAVSRYEDSAGVHIRVLYFPVRGQTDTRRDRYYLMIDGAVNQNN